MASVSFKGVFPILITPFDDHGNLDLESFDRTVRFMADIGVNGVTIIGVLGESNRMLDAEREQLNHCRPLEITIAQNAARCRYYETY